MIPEAGLGKHDTNVMPLRGVRVVALEHAVAGPLCTRHLADLGAVVTKIEGPSGDFARTYDSTVRGESAYFVWLNRGKQSVVLDLERTRDRRILESMLSDADVFVHNQGPGVVDRMGFGWPSVHRRWPQMITCAISGYGRDGPYRDRKAFDLLLQAESGLMSITGSPEQPARVGISIADISAGMYALSSILAALLLRARTNEGTLIDISMLECITEWMMAPVYHQLYGAGPPARTGPRHNMIVPYGPYRVGDGSHVILVAQSPDHWGRLCAQVLLRPKLEDDPRFATNELRLRNRGQLEAGIEDALASETYATVLGRLDSAGLPTATMRDLAGLVSHPQLRARERWVEIDTEGGRVTGLRPPFNLEGMPSLASAVPALDQHGPVLRRAVEASWTGDEHG